MQNTKTINIVAGVGVILAVIFGVSYLKPTTVNNIVNVPEQQAQQVAQNYGAVPTLDGVDNPYVKINGYAEYWYSAGITSTSSAFCSVLNPFAPATTTVLAAGTRISGTISAASSYDISTSTTLYGSSTPAFVYADSVGAAAQKITNWYPRYASSTAAVVGKELYIDINYPVVAQEYPYILTGTQRLNWRIATATPGTDYYEGLCTAKFRKN